MKAKTWPSCVYKKCTLIIRSFSHTICHFELTSISKTIIAFSESANNFRRGNNIYFLNILIFYYAFASWWENWLAITLMSLIVLKFTEAREHNIYVIMKTYMLLCSSCFFEIWALCVSWITYDHLYYTPCLACWALLGSLVPAMCNRTSCAQVLELLQSHCGDNRGGAHCFHDKYHIP